MRYIARNNQNVTISKAFHRRQAERNEVHAQISVSKQAPLALRRHPREAGGRGSGRRGRVTRGTFTLILMDPFSRTVASFVSPGTTHERLKQCPARDHQQPPSFPNKTPTAVLIPPFLSLHNNPLTQASRKLYSP